MKVNIVSEDGTPEKTKITLSDGTPLPGVQHVLASIGVGEVSKAVIAFILPQLDMKGLVATVSEPHLRELAASYGLRLVQGPVLEDKFARLVEWISENEDPQSSGGVERDLLIEAVRDAIAGPTMKEEGHNDVE